MPTIQSFTRQCRELQSRYRESIGEPMGVGPFRSSKNLQISMIRNGEQTSKNFLTPFSFEYAKHRVAGKQKNETIEEYRLFYVRPCFIAIETKYTDVLGTNSAQSKSLVRQKALIRQLGHFTAEAETQLLDGTKAISQIYLNYLLSECYRIMEPAHESYSVVLAPAAHPTTAEEVSSLREELKEEFMYNVMDVSLEHFVEKALSVCPKKYRKAFEDFGDRYLRFE